MTTYPSKAVQIAALKQDEASAKDPPKYTDYADIFSFNLPIQFLENTGINKYAMELQDGKKPLYGPIYSLRPVELEILKTYIKAYLKTRFI